VETTEDEIEGARLEVWERWKSERVREWEKCLFQIFPDHKEPDQYDNDDEDNSDI
jgi:hypothetical protein